MQIEIRLTGQPAEGDAVVRFMHTPDDPSHKLLEIPVENWEEMDSPEVVTVTIEPASE